MNKVWVTQEVQLDFSGAEAFGEVQFLTHEDLNNTKGSLHNEAVLADVSHKLRKFDPENDWIVIAGSPYIAAVTFLILGHRKIRSIRVLRWDNRDRVYRPMHMDLRQETIGVA